MTTQINNQSADLHSTEWVSAPVLDVTRSVYNADNPLLEDYREVHFKPYRVIYEIIGSHVVILGCFEGRRDMQSLLERRLLR